MHKIKSGICHFLLCASLRADKFYPAEWIKQDFNLAEFFVHFGEGEERIRTLQEILEKGCVTGNLKYIHWVIDKQRETGLPLPVSAILPSIEKLIYGGFDEILSFISPFWDLSSLPEERKNHLINTAIEIGYPHTVQVLEKIGFVLSEEQQHRCAELSAILIEEPLASVPPPINSFHHQAHGGDENQQIYQHEYRVAVAYALYHLKKTDCDFLKLIENLGHRRQRMAVLGKLHGLEYYGAPTNQQMITYFSTPYAEYGEKIHKKYPFLPFCVTAQLNGRKIELTQINEDSWLHPDGEHRNEVLQEVVSLCQKICTTVYPAQKKNALAYELGKIIWWMSHAPPFLRGTPTVLSILTDALWIYHGFLPPSKSLDLNCEALTYDTLEAFAHDISTQSEPECSGQDPFVSSCQKGEIEKLIGVVKQHKEGVISLTDIQIARGLYNVITGGYDAILLQLRFLWKMETLSAQEQQQFIALALRIGYPNTVRLLQQLGCTLTPVQEESLRQLQEGMRTPYPLPAPPAINSGHHEAHGGEDNFLLYQREYRLLTGYILYQLQKQPPDFCQLIEDLGHRRRHMAALGKLIGMEFFGTPTNQHMYTYFSPVYEVYGQRAVEKYPHLPKTIFGTWNGSSIPLTQIHEMFWLHPKGKHRAKTLNIIASLCHKALFEKGVSLLHTFGSLIWWMSHAPPFLRGTPTLIYALLDAFCLYHQMPLLSKTPDLNCEALLYDNEEEFALYMVHREMK